MIRRPGALGTGLLLSVGSLLATAALLLLAELSARVFSPEACGRVHQEAEMVAVSRRYLAPCFTHERRGSDEYLVPSPSGDNPQSTALLRRRSAGVARIAVIGESSADLLAKQLAQVSNEPGCAGQYEVLNCAQPGSALEHVERRFNEVLGYEPDAVVLLFGHNISFRFPLDDQQLRIQGLRAQSCLLSQLAPPPPPPDAPPLETRLDALARFLRQAAATARARNVALAVATMPANLWLPPGGGAREANDPRFLEAQFLEASGHRADAIRRLEGLATDPGPALWHYELGELLARAGGQDQRAYRELHRALDDDGLRMRAPGAVNDLLRGVAGEEKLRLRDTERALEARAPSGLPGWDSFIDNCHLLPAAIDQEAVALLALLRDVVPLGSACGAGATPDSRKSLADVLTGVFNLTAMGPNNNLGEIWYRGLALAVESWVGRDADSADRDVRAFLDSPEFAAARGEERSARVLVAIAEGYHRAGRRERALEINQEARTAGGAEPWVQQGLFCLRQGDPTAARAAFERALALDPARADARSFLGWLNSPPR